MDFAQVDDGLLSSSTITTRMQARDSALLISELRSVFRVRNVFECVASSSYIVAASLIFTFENNSGGPFTLYNVTSSWTSSSITWSNQPSATALPGNLPAFPGSPTANIPITVDITPSAMFWTVSANRNFGLRIHSASSTTASIWSPLASASLRPVLQLTVTNIISMTVNAGVLSLSGQASVYTVEISLYRSPCSVEFAPCTVVLSLASSNSTVATFQVPSVTISNTNKVASVPVLGLSQGTASLSARAVSGSQIQWFPTGVSIDTKVVSVTCPARYAGANCSQSAPRTVFAMPQDNVCAIQITLEQTTARCAVWPGIQQETAATTVRPGQPSLSFPSKHACNAHWASTPMLPLALSVHTASTAQSLLQTDLRARLVPLDVFPILSLAAAFA
eukprot:ANDGO_08303.mRNA.1 hypothetical protein